MRKYFFILIFPSLSVSAQYGSGVNGAITNPGTTIFTDDKRLALTANASSGQATITVSSDATVTFNDGDLVLVIQMLGTGAGQYEEATISSRTATSITFTSNLIYSYTDNGSTNAAQVIKIYQYTNVTLTTPGDIITCDAWDGQTGGVCCFKVSGTLDGDADGKVHANEKGYRGGNGGSAVMGTYGGGGGFRGSGGSPGTVGCAGCGGCSGGTITCGTACANKGGGGAGGNVAGSNPDGGAGGGMDYSISYACHSSGEDGFTGEGPGAGKYNSGSGVYDAATNNSIMANWGVSSGTDLLMGGGGAGGKQGTVPGGGAGGGGGGGGTGSGTSGEVGLQAASPLGAAGGIGGIGGGIILAMVNNLTGTLIIESKGGNGGNGSTGNTGGTGGKGGDKGAGGTAGGGGGGVGGLGGRGGCPGHGGAGGVIAVQTGSTTYTGFTTTGGAIGIHGTGGTGGTGGAGGSGNVNGTGGAGGQGGYSSDGCTGSAGSAASGTTGGAGGAGAAPAPANGCVSDESYCNSISGGTGVILPIELLSFTGFSKGETNSLHWITASEINNDYFTLYRSEDLESWEKLVDIKGAGNSTSQRKYEFSDESPLTDKINFYQLKQTDFAGKSTHSHIIAILSKGKPSIYIAQNTINVIVSQTSDVDYDVIDLSGHILLSAKNLSLPQGLYTIDISHFASSAYLLRIKVGEKIQSIKFIKQ